jgi:hypothetical protein
MAPLRNALLCLMATSVTVYAEHLKVVWSSGDFSKISGPAGGNTNGNYSGFAIIKDAGDAIYDRGFPDDHSPCYNTGDSRELTIEGDCWSTPASSSARTSLGATLTCVRSRMVTKLQLLVT